MRKYIFLLFVIVVGFSVDDVQKEIITLEWSDKTGLAEGDAFVSFENGQVNVKPINLNYKDIGIQISGKHGFDKKMNYDLIFDVVGKSPFRRSIKSLKLGGHYVIAIPGILKILQGSCILWQKKHDFSSIFILSFPGSFFVGRKFRRAFFC